MNRRKKEVSGVVHGARPCVICQQRQRETRRDKDKKSSRERGIQRRQRQTESDGEMGEKKVRMDVDEDVTVEDPEKEKAKKSKKRIERSTLKRMIHVPNCNSVLWHDLSQSECVGLSLAKRFLRS